MRNSKINILNIDFENITKNELLLRLRDYISERKKTFVVTANPEIVMYANQDNKYQSIINSADFVIADGIGVVIGSKVLGSPLPERIAGFDLMVELLKLGNENGWSAYFLGSKKDVIEKAVQNIHHSFPSLQIAGWHDGYFNWEASTIPEEIREKKPDLIFVALGLPRQEKWIYENIGGFENGLFMGVGGSFDVLSGTVKRAPIVWQKLNLEWLYRLLKQPSRWKRMLALPLFMVKIFREKLRTKK
ncbi:WecB/TagA/CpsF family glycosyltransferase [Neobacillus sp. SAB-20_R2A]|uniref:WecB/TagA/CpsF family glycosyltransferase n=1 Tax=Neobacillus sp. SAB-20_R2A TaxID=3120519 RepID=UPI003C6E52FD